MRPIIVPKRQRKVEKLIQIYKEEESKSKSDFDQFFLSEALTLNITYPKFESLIIKNPQPIVPFRPPNKKKQFVKKKFECRKCPVNFDSYDERHQHYLNLHVENSWKQVQHLLCLLEYLSKIKSMCLDSSLTLLIHLNSLYSIGSDSYPHSGSVQRHLVEIGVVLWII